MGIQGLLPLLKSIHKPCSLKKFEGKTLGVDAYGWLHRGTVTCAMELARGQPTRKFVDFALHRVRMLQHFGVIPFLIFDGDYLPSKAATEKERAKRREDSKKAGQELLNAGKTSLAHLEFQKAVDVTPEMARQLIDELKEIGVQYIVAPYEADAQMVYLERKGIIQGILSEDSDLLVFGAKCLLTKLDQYGNCIEINKADFCACKDITLTGWSDAEFRRMAILSGCDYLASINNMGLKTAYRMVRKHKTIEKVIRMLQFDGKFYVPKGYLEAFYQAEHTFLHQRVFCPRARTLVLHTQPHHPIDAEKMPFIGADVEPKIAQAVARGDLNPMTKEPITVQTIRKNKMVSSITPQSSRLGPMGSASSNHIKKGKAIDAFFMPKRIPLGELDPNCFTPSPSQQETLRRNSGPWMANSLPRPYLSRSPTEDDNSPQSAPVQIRSSTGRAHIRSPTVSEPRPPKRARLCADEEVNSTTQKMELGRSRFFASAAPEPSPSVGRIGKSKRSKKIDITIFSDDSVEEAMLSLPDAEDFNPRVTKVPVFNEQLANDGTPSRDSNCSEHFRIAQDNTPSQDTTPALTAETSVASSAEQPLTPVEASVQTGSIQKLKENFSYAASTPISRSNLRAPPSPASSASRPSKIPVPVKASVKNSVAFSTTAKLTPLQRLGVSVMNRPKLPLTPPQTPVFQTISKISRRSLLSKESVPFPEVAQEFEKGAAVDPASVPLPDPDELENAALAKPSGSEDLIIHDSEGEDEAFSPCAETESCAHNFDLGRFVYAG